MSYQFPEHLYFEKEHHVWCSLESKQCIRIGIDQLGLASLGELAHLSLNPQGSAIQSGATDGCVGSSKNDWRTDFTSQWHHPGSQPIRAGRSLSGQSGPIWKRLAGRSRNKDSGPEVTNTVSFPSSSISLLFKYNKNY